MSTDDETLIEIPAALIARAVGILREAGAHQQVMGLAGSGESMRKFADHLELVASVALITARDGLDETK